MTEGVGCHFKGITNISHSLTHGLAFLTKCEKFPELIYTHLKWNNQLFIMDKLFTL